MKYHHSMNRWKIGCADRHTPGVRKAAILVLSPCRLIDLFRFLYVLEISTFYVKSAVDSASLVWLMKRQRKLGIIPHSG